MGAQYAVTPASHLTGEMFCVKFANVHVDMKPGGIQREESQVPGVGEGVRTPTITGAGVHP